MRKPAHLLDLSGYEELLEFSWEVWCPGITINRRKSPLSFRYVCEKLTCRVCGCPQLRERGPCWAGCCVEAGTGAFHRRCLSSSPSPSNTNDNTCLRQYIKVTVFSRCSLREALPTCCPDRQTGKPNEDRIQHHDKTAKTKDGKHEYRVVQTVQANVTWTERRGDIGPS